MSRAILVIEDEPAMRLLVQEYLEFLGYRVLSAPDGTTAIKIGDSEPFSLAFVDINLPDMSGVDVMRKLRESGIASPFVVVSANLRESFADEIESLSVHKVLEKPVDLTDIEAVVKDLVGSPGTPH